MGCEGREVIDYPAAPGQLPGLNWGSAREDDGGEGGDGDEGGKEASHGFLLQSPPLGESPRRVSRAFSRNSRGLAERAGRILSREQLMEMVRGSAEEAFDRSIDVHVSRLRQKLGDDAARPPLSEQLATIQQLIDQDLEPDPEGGGPRIRRGVAEGAHRDDALKRYPHDPRKVRVAGYQARLQSIAAAAARWLERNDSCTTYSAGSRRRTAR